MSFYTSLRVFFAAHSDAVFNYNLAGSILVERKILSDLLDIQNRCIEDLTGSLTVTRLAGHALLAAFITSEKRAMVALAGLQAIVDDGSSVGSPNGTTTKLIRMAIDSKFAANTQVLTAEDLGEGNRDEYIAKAAALLVD